MSIAMYLAFDGSSDLLGLRGLLGVCGQCDRARGTLRWWLDRLGHALGDKERSQVLPEPIGLLQAGAGSEVEHVDPGGGRTVEVGGDLLVAAHHPGRRVVAE